MNHRARISVYYEIKKKFFWPGLKKTIDAVIKKCEVCKKVNRKRNNEPIFIESRRPLEKFAVDTLVIDQDENPILIEINYFTRFSYAQKLRNKRTDSVIEKLEWLKEEKPEIIITDHGKEFDSSKFKEFCRTLGIEHRLVGIESHRSNGRVERLIRTLKERILKSDENNLKERTREAVNNYNNSFHSRIECTPNERKKRGLMMN